MSPRYFSSSIDNNSGNFQRLINQNEGFEILKAIVVFFIPSSTDHEYMPRFFDQP